MCVSAFQDRMLRAYLDTLGRENRAQAVRDCEHDLRDLGLHARDY